MTLRSVIMGVGGYVPSRVLTNHDIAKNVETSHEWIVERTGIHQRHIAADGEVTSDLAAHAARVALKNAKLTINDIDLLVLATCTPDETMPSCATRVQHKLGMNHGAAFDVNAACSGFVYAMSVSDAMIRAHQAKRVLVIGADTFTRILDWKDRGTCILFGDGAGAIILEAKEQKGTTADRGILYTRINSDGQYAELLNTDGGVSKTRTAGLVTMQGKEVFRHAVQKMGDAIIDGLEMLKLSSADLNWVVPHQANKRILDATAKRLSLPAEKLISTVAEHANTSAASIPLALAKAAESGRLKPGDLVATPALGAGFTWGTCILRW